MQQVGVAQIHPSCAGLINLSIGLVGRSRLVLQLVFTPTIADTFLNIIDCVA